MRAYLRTQLVRSLARFLPDCQTRQPSAGETRRAVLTFEDGPHPDSTPALLDFLEEQQLSAHFFVVGEQAALYPDLVAEIARRGHGLGNHTWHHADLWRVSLRRAVQEIQDCSRLLDDLTGSLPVWWRPPHGHVTRPLIRWCERNGMQTVLWDVLAPDYSRIGSAARVQNVLEHQTRPGSIIAFHDTPRSANLLMTALQHSLPRLQEQGWRLGKLEQPRPTPIPQAAQSEPASTTVDSGSKRSAA